MGAAILAVGGPNLVRGDGWDPAPLVLAGVLLVLVLGSGGRFRSATVIGCIVAAVAIDVLTDVTGVSPLAVLAPIVVVMAVVALRGTTIP